ncbi:MAG: prefoldin subunit alpha [Promethearchaeota archaeon]
MAQNTEDLTKLYYTYQELDANFKYISEQLEYLNSDQVGINIAKKTLDSLKEIKSNEEIILPIGNYAFIKAKIENPKEVLVSIGKDVLVEKNIENALLYIRKIEEDNLKARNILEEQLKNIRKQLDQIAPILQQFVDANNPSK